MALEDPVVAEMDRLLRRAAFLWLSTHPDPPTPYSTVQNSFLIAAENAYFGVVGHRGRTLVR